MEQWRQVHFEPLTPLRFIERSARVFPDKIAIVHNHRRYTYREFGERVFRQASALRAHGLQSGDRVAMLCPNIPAMIEAHFGVLLAGGIIVPINFRLSAPEIKYILDHAGCKFLMVDTEFAPLVEHSVSALPALEKIIGIADDPAFPMFGDIEYEAFLASGDPTPVSVRVSDEMAPIAINYTSGTTGRPKGVTFCHRGAYLDALGGAIEAQYNLASVFLWTLPMFHCNGWCFIWGLTALGARHVCLRKFDPAVAWKLIAQERVTHFNGAQVVLIALVNDPTAPQKFSWPVTVMTGGAPPSPTIIAKLTDMGARLNHIYGLTEVYGPFTICAHQEHWAELPMNERARLLARQGVDFTVDGMVRVVDENMQDVPADGQTMGEVILRGNMVMLGYWNEPDATASAFRGGWFHTGDVGVMEPDGYISLRDRSKDIIISGAENISSIEVEQVIYSHPAVLECAVVAMPSEKWGESPKAFVTLKPGAQATEQDIINHCRANLAHYKAPAAVEFGPLPKTSTGKIQKFQLREKEWAGKEKRIQG